jgi:hypothetical protein
MRTLRTLLWIGIAAALPASAQFFTITSPTPQYTGNTTVIPVVGANFSSTSSLSAGGQTVSFSNPMLVLTVGAGWTAWGSPPNTESSTPRVVANEGPTVTITLSSPSRTFGFEIEPSNHTGPYAMTATFFNGLTALGAITLPLTDVTASVEAASSATPITSVVITTPSAAGGFALAQLRFGNLLLSPITGVPALGPTSMGGLALLLAAAGSLLARRQLA